jgi:hypothetical protein
MPFRCRTLVLAAAMLLAVSAQAGAGTAPTTIRVWSVPTSNRLTDAPPKGLSAGDVLRQRTRLFNAAPQFGKPRGAVVGYDVSVVRLSSPTQATAVVVVHLPGGTLQVRGVGRIGAGSNTAHVISGTGVFAGARGTETEIDDPHAALALNVYHLTYSVA